MRRVGETAGSELEAPDDVDARQDDDGDLLTLSEAPPAKRRSYRKPLLIGVAAAVALITAGAGTVAALTKSVTITVDGQQRQITTLAGTVDGALSAAGISVADHDTLAPAKGATIADGSKIALERGRLLTLTIDGQQRQVWTTATTVDEALAELGRDSTDLQLSADRSRPIPLTGLAVTAETLHTVTVANRATKRATVTSAAETVGDLLTRTGHQGRQVRPGVSGAGQRGDRRHHRHCADAAQGAGGGGQEPAEEHVYGRQDRP